MTPDQARQLMHEWTPSPALRQHMECVARCMDHYAAILDPGNAADWITTGILHDFDYEKHPSQEEHPFVGIKHLESLGVAEPIRTAILGHATYSGVPRETPMSVALFACDELAGFIVACCKVRPNGIADLAPKSVKKKLKTLNFAAAVSREDIAQGIEELASIIPGIDITQHVEHCIDALRQDADRLELAPN